MRLKAAIPDFVRVLVDHHPAALRGRSLRDIMPIRDRRPEQLLELFANWRHRPAAMAQAPPSLVFAAVGQARAAARSLLSGKAGYSAVCSPRGRYAVRSTSLNCARCALHQPPYRRPSKRTQEDRHERLAYLAAASRPGPAGTVVGFKASTKPSSKTAAGQQNTFTWEVQGPFHTSQPETFSEPSDQFDWDTAGLRAGVYRVKVIVATTTAATPAVTPPAGGGAASLTGGSGTAGPRRRSPRSAARRPPRRPRIPRCSSPLHPRQPDQMARCR